MDAKTALEALTQGAGDKDTALEKKAQLDQIAQTERLLLQELELAQKQKEKAKENHEKVAQRLKQIQQKQEELLVRFQDVRTTNIQSAAQRSLDSVNERLLQFEDKVRTLEAQVDLSEIFEKSRNVEEQYADL